MTSTSHRFRIASFAAALAMLATGIVAFARSNSAAAGETVRGIDEDGLFLAIEQDGEWFDVDIHMYYQEGATEAELAEARADVLARFPGAIERTPSDVSAQYTLIGPTWYAKEVSWRYNPAGKPAAVNFELEAATGAVGTWNAAGADWHFSYEGTTTNGTGACGVTKDAVNTVGWAPQAGQTLAITCGWSQQTGAKRYFTEFDMEVDPAWNWTNSTTTPNTDLQSVLLHEFGHALGLNHSQANKCPGPSMCASYAPKALVRSLNKDDLDGLLALYGASTVTPTATATAPKSPTPKPTVGAQRGPYRAVALGAARQ